MSEVISYSRKPEEIRLKVKRPASPIIKNIEYDEIDKLRESNRQEREHGKEMSVSSDNGEVFEGSQGIGIRNELMKRIPLSTGYKMDYPHGIVIKQSDRNNYYRGENQIYERSIPSLLRKLSRFSNPKEKDLFRLVADMRIFEFRKLLENFDHISYWNKNGCSVLYDVLAQHYGLDTCWLDITNDFDVALFFATCKYDSQLKAWRPLSKSDIAQNENTQYGVIYQASRDDQKLNWATFCRNFLAYQDDGCLQIPRRYFTHPQDKHNMQPANLIYPVGFQPFMRCHMQNAFAIYMYSARPLQDDSQFQKLLFRQSEQFSEKIFEEMEGGKKIYPNEGLLEIQDLIEHISTATTFSSEAFNYALYRSHRYNSRMKKKCLNDVNSFYIEEGKCIRIQESTPRELIPDRNMIESINKLYENFSIEDTYGIKIKEKQFAALNLPIFEQWMLIDNPPEAGIIDFRRHTLTHNYSFLADVLASLTELSVYNPNPERIYDLSLKNQ